MNNVLRDFKRFQRRVLGEGVRLETIHDSRKTFRTHAADVIPIQTLAKIIGDTPAVLLDFYAKPKAEHADALRAAFGEGAADLKLVG